jgi:hypothetical protein
MIVTYFKGLRSTKPDSNRELSTILEDIQTGKWKAVVERCRTDLSKKNLLPCFTPTGIFNHRSIKGLEEYNGIVCLDIDHVEDPEALKKEAAKISWVHAAFITPSGKGLKVIVKTSATVENYKEVEETVQAAFRDETNFVRDNHCKDIARIQFVSYDPDLYYNPTSSTF